MPAISCSPVAKNSSVVHEPRRPGTEHTAHIPSSRARSFHSRRSALSDIAQTVHGCPELDGRALVGALEALHRPAQTH